MIELLTSVMTAIGMVIVAFVVFVLALIAYSLITGKREVTFTGARWLVMVTIRREDSDE